MKVSKKNEIDKDLLMLVYKDINNAEMNYEI